jgi:hypothetical protein
MRVCCHTYRTMHAPLICALAGLLPESRSHTDTHMTNRTSQQIVMHEHDE